MATKYENIYIFDINKYILSGKEVYCIDKRNCEIFNVGELTAKEYIEIYEYENTDNRFEFYIEKSEEENDM